MRSLTRLPRSLRTNKVAAWGGCSCTGRAPGANRLGNCAPRKIGASWTWSVFIKGLKTLPIMPVDRCGGLAGPYRTVLQKSNKNARVYRFLLRARICFPFVANFLVAPRPVTTIPDTATLRSTARGIYFRPYFHVAGVMYEKLFPNVS